MRKTLVLLSAAVFALPACVEDSRGGSSREDARGAGRLELPLLPEPYGFTLHGPDCYKASTVPTADPVSDLADWYGSMMPDLGYKMNYEKPFFTDGLEEEVCGKYLRVPKTWGHRRVDQAWSAAWEEREGIFCPTVWVTAWSTKTGDVYLHFAEGATCLL